MYYGLLITDEAAGDVRPTFDVDAIAEITSYVDYTDFSKRLRKLGFSEDSSKGAPVCRWLSGQTKLDVMSAPSRYPPATAGATDPPPVPASSTTSRLCRLMCGRSLTFRKYFQFYWGLRPQMIRAEP